MIRRKTLAIAALGLGLAMGAGITTANAAVMTASRSGCTVWTDDWYTFKVKDTAGNNQFTAGDWKTNWSSTGRLVNKNGMGTTVSAKVASSPERIVDMRACRGNTIGGVTCGGWASAAS